MNPATSCPDRQRLELLARGELPFAQVEALAEHLEQCDDCARTMQTLPGEDTLAELVRHQAKEDDKPPDPILQELMGRLRILCTSVPEASRSINPEDYEFLAPAKGSNELGWLAHYRVLQIVGSGGMGVVFRAEDTQLRRITALKAMKPGWAASSTAKQRFLREAQAAAALNHDHIVTIYQVGEDRGVPFLAMEFLEGMSLEDYLQKGQQIPGGEILRVGREIAQGLVVAHERGLIHRDIKPANIWLEPPHGRVKILDFGLARSVDDPAQLTKPGAIVGTPGYLAPEQANGLQTDARTDLFSLGCVLYRLCTGQVPFPGETTLAALAALTLEEPKSVRVANPTISEAMAELAMKLLAKRPEQRPQTAQEVVAAFEAIERGTAERPPSLPISSRRSNFHIIAWIAGALLLVGIGLYDLVAAHRQIAWVAGALLLVGGPLVAWQIFIRSKDGSNEVEVRLPADATVKVKKDGDSILTIEPNPRRGQPSKVQYLSDMQEFDVRVSEARFARNGDLGYGNRSRLGLAPNRAFGYILGRHGCTTHSIS